MKQLRPQQSHLRPKEDLFRDHNILESDFCKTNLAWQTLEEIYDDYCKFSSENRVKTAADGVVTRLLAASDSGVHSVRKRIKDPEHLVAKIIRRAICECNPKSESKKKQETDNKYNQVTKANYKTIVDDIVGIRILHLQKSDFEKVHKYLMDEFSVKGKPIAKYRDGDDRQFYTNIDKRIKVEKNVLGYRSVHYNVTCSLNDRHNTNLNVEVQVRTLAEELWGEVSHTVSYPLNKSDGIMNTFVDILSVSTGLADYLTSAIMGLHDFSVAIYENEQRKQKEVDKYEKNILELSNNIADIKKTVKDLYAKKEISEIAHKKLTKLMPQSYDLFTSSQLLQAFSSSLLVSQVLKDCSINLFTSPVFKELFSGINKMSQAYSTILPQIVKPIRNKSMVVTDATSTLPAVNADVIIIDDKKEED